MISIAIWRRWRSPSFPFGPPDKVAREVLACEQSNRFRRDRREGHVEKPRIARPVRQMHRACKVARRFDVIAQRREFGMDSNT